LKESARRLEEEHTTQRDANEAYEAWREREIARRGSRSHGDRAVKPHDPPEGPDGKVNATDHHSRMVRTAAQPAKQGYPRRGSAEQVLRRNNPHSHTALVSQGIQMFSIPPPLCWPKFTHHVSTY
jgi:hypothetical protein